MNKQIKNTLLIKQISDVKKTKKEGDKIISIEERTVTMKIKEDDMSFTITYKDSLTTHPLKHLTLADLNEEVDVDLKLFQSSRQKTIDEV